MAGVLLFQGNIATCVSFVFKLKYTDIMRNYVIGLHTNNNK